MSREPRHREIDPLVARFVSMVPTKHGIWVGNVIVDVNFHYLGMTRSQSHLRFKAVGPEPEDVLLFTILKDHAVTAARRGYGESAELIISSASDAMQKIEDNHHVMYMFTRGG